jgi:hypothetical protein
VKHLEENAGPVDVTLTAGARYADTSPIAPLTPKENA